MLRNRNLRAMIGRGLSGPFRSVGSSFVARIATFPITALSGLATSYLLISNYGPDVYGIVALLATFFLLIPFADLGMGAPIMNGVSSGALSSSEKHDLVRRVFWLLTASSASLISMFLLLGLLVSWSSLLGNTLLDVHTLNHAFTATVVIFLIAIPLGIGQRILVGLGLNHISVMFAACSSIASLVVTLGVLQVDAPPAYAAIAPSMGILVSSTLAFVYSLRKLRMKLRDFKTITGLRVRSLFSDGAPMLVVMLAVPIAFQSHRIIISHYSTPSELAVYGLGMQLYIPLWSLVSTSAIAMWPIFARRRSTGSDSRKLFSISLGAFFGAGVIAAVIIFLVSPLFAHVVSSGQISLNGPFLAALGLLMLIQCIQQVPGSFLTSVSGLRFQSICVTIMAIFSVTIAIILTIRIGATGPVIATAFAVLCFQVFPGIWKSMKTFGDPNVSQDYRLGSTKEDTL